SSLLPRCVVVSTEPISSGLTCSCERNTCARFLTTGCCPMPEPRKHEKYDALINSCQALAPVRTAVAHPCDESSLFGAVQAAQAAIITPILVGPEARIRALARSLDVDLAGLEVINTAHSHASAEKAVAIVRAGEAEALMKGSLHTDELIAEVVRKDTGLRTDRRISHVFIMD